MIDTIQLVDKTVALAQIRFNTESNGSSFCWRLILDGEEVIVDSVDIQAPVFTSKDWIEPIQKFKHHISVVNCTIHVDQMGKAIITASR